MTKRRSIQQIHNAVERSILPGGFLILGITESPDRGFIAIVGRIGEIGEWQGTGRTPEEALQAAVTAAEEGEQS